MTDIIAHACTRLRSRDSPDQEKLWKEYGYKESCPGGGCEGLPLARPVFARLRVQDRQPERVRATRGCGEIPGEERWMWSYTTSMREFPPTGREEALAKKRIYPDLRPGRYFPIMLRTLEFGVGRITRQRRSAVRRSGPLRKRSRSRAAPAIEARQRMLSALDADKKLRSRRRYRQLQDRRSAAHDPVPEPLFDDCQ